MTKKDYQLIAYLLREKTKSHVDDYGSLVEEWAKWLSFTQAKFDRNKFLNACGIED